MGRKDSFTEVAQPEGLEGVGGSGQKNNMGTCPGIGAGPAPVLPSLSSSQERYGILASVAGHTSQERKRRQRLRASVFALTLPLSLGPCWVLWAAAPKASGLIQGPQRRLMGSLLQVRLG